MYNINSEPLQLQGYQLEAPQIRLGQNKKAVVKNGNYQLRDKVLEPHTFKNYFFCYSIGKVKRDDQDDADYALDQMKEASKTFGISIL